MIYQLYAIRDTKTGFMTPVCEVNEDAAIRNFYHSVAASEGILRTFSKDFDLYKIGLYDADRGVISPVVPILNVASASDAVNFVHKESGD